MWWELNQERMTDADRVKITAKKDSKKSPNADENKADKKRESEKPCNVDINTSISVSLRHLDKPTSGEAGVMGEGGVLVMQ